MGVFSKAIIRGGFSTVYRPTSVLPVTSDQLSKNSPSEIELSPGTGSSQVDLEYIAQLTIAASTNADYDLAGSLVDRFGNVITFVKIKGLWIKASASNVNNVKLKPAAATSFLGPFNAAADTLSVPPGGVLMLCAPVSGWAVGAGATDKINLANSGAGSSVVFDLHIIGTSA
jgi:hypothetical protein